MRYFLFFTIILFSFILKAQQEYSEYDFHSPLEIPLILAANFGELRTNHFHTGIDFKTNHRTGYKIHSIDDGYVSRIKVSPWGYGKVVYIDHYNGLTSVYAHCESFKGEIQKLVEERQKTNQDFAFDYYPKKDSLKVQKGQVIALSGNTGGSTAPHLHFEIRETKSEDALNPLLFNFDIKDTRTPRIRGLKIYSVTKEGYRIPGKSFRLNTYPNGDNYRIKGNKITLSADFASQNGGIGLAFDAIDQLNGANNICGIHRSYLIVDDDTLFSQDMTRISFFTNRQINTHKDYEEFHNRRKHYHKSFKTEHNRLPIYRKQENRGIINVEPGKSYRIVYKCYDSYGNESSIDFSIQIRQGKQPEHFTLYAGKKKLYPDAPYMNIDSSKYLFFPQMLLYEPTPLILKSKNPGHLQFGDSEIPLDGYYDLMLPLAPNKNAKQYYVNHIDYRGRKTPISGSVKDGWITIESREFGTFEVAKDTIPPSITNYNFTNGSNVRGKKLIWRINDEETSIIDYDIFIDGQWHLLAWEPKRRAFYFSPKNDLKGTKTVKIIAKDMCGNKSTKTYQLNF